MIRKNISLKDKEDSNVQTVQMTWAKGTEGREWTHPGDQPCHPCQGRWTHPPPCAPASSGCCTPPGRTGSGQWLPVWVDSGSSAVTRANTNTLVWACLISSHGARINITTFTWRYRWAEKGVQHSFRASRYFQRSCATGSSKPMPGHSEQRATARNRL